MNKSSLYHRILASPKAEDAGVFVHKCAIPSGEEICEGAISKWQCEGCGIAWSFSVHVVDGLRMIACLHIEPEPN